MKTFRKIFLVFMAVSFIASATLAIDSFAKGDIKKTTEWSTVAGLSALAPVTPIASLKLGLFSPGIDALTRNASRFGQDTKANGGNIVASDHTLFVRKEITGSLGSGIKKLIEPSTVKTDGVTNFDGDKLPEGENFAIEAIAIRQGSHATITDSKNIVNYTNVMSSVEVEFRSAVLVISQENKELVRLPMASLLVQGAGLRTVKEEAYKLENCPVLIEKKPIQINIEFPATMATISTSTNKFHVEVQLLGKVTGKRNV